MAGLAMQTGLRFRASSAVPVGNQNLGTIDVAAFQPGVTQQVQSRGQALGLGTPPGLAFWVGTGCLVALVLIRHSLPR